MLAPTNLLNISFIPFYGRLSYLKLFKVVIHSLLWFNFGFSLGFFF